MPCAVACKGFEARVAARPLARLAPLLPCSLSTPPKWECRLCGTTPEAPLYFWASSFCFREMPPLAAKRFTSRSFFLEASTEAAAVAEALGRAAAAVAVRLGASPLASLSLLVLASEAAVAVAVGLAERAWMASAIFSGHWSLRRWWVTSSSTKFNGLLSRVPMS